MCFTVPVRGRLLYEPACVLNSAHSAHEAWSPTDSHWSRSALAHTPSASLLAVSGRSTRRCDHGSKPSSHDGPRTEGVSPPRCTYAGSSNRVWLSPHMETRKASPLHQVASHTHNNSLTYVHRGGLTPSVRGPSCEEGFDPWSHLRVERPDTARSDALGV